MRLLARLRIIDDSDRAEELARRFRADLDAVMRELAGHHVLDLEATHPSLEEVFLGYYDEGEAM